MTQTPYQGPPAGYPQQPPQGPPAGYQVPQYPPPNQPYPPAQQAPAGPPPAQYQPMPEPQYQAQPAAGGDWADVGDPGAGIGGDGDSPALHQLEGRLIFWRPRPGGLGMGTAYDKSKGMEEQMRVDIIVCDGPPIPAHVNGETNVATPFAAGPKHAPFFVGNVMVNKVILDKLRDFCDPINPNPKATCLARFVKTPPRGQGKPYNDLKPATEADKVLARPIYANWDAIKAAGQAARPDQFATAAAPAQQWQQPAAQPQYAQQPPSTQYNPAGQQPPYAPPSGYGQPQAPTGYDPQPGQQWPTPAPQQGPPAGYQGQPPPYGA